MKETKSKQMHLLLTPSLHAEIKSRADNAGESVNEHIESMLIGYMHPLKTLKFKNKEHHAFFQDLASHMDDNGHKALIYVLGLNNDIRAHISDVYDSGKRKIKLEGLEAAWQTGGSLDATRLAFNLYNGHTASRLDPPMREDKDIYYAPRSIFASQDAEYFIEALKFML